MIRHIDYNEMVCDQCGATEKVWDGCPALRAWLIREEGTPRDGYHVAHYCPACTPTVLAAGPQPPTGEWIDPEPRRNYNVKPEGG